MNILVDIGNTNTSIALVDGKKYLKKYFIHTSKETICPKAFFRLLGRFSGKVDRIIVVSVVPEFLSILSAALGRVFPNAEISVVGKNIKVPIKNRYRKPKQVGQDRLVTAYAALLKARSPLVVIDFGTAVTMDYVNERGEYEGGLIFPGMRLALASLVNNTALLPSVALRSANGLIGRDTKGSMNNGILFGYAAMCDGLIERFFERYGKKVRIIATGGDSSMIAKHSRYIEKVYPTLIFDGLCEMGRR
ncbi:MAG TPA: type III pantothenate kinase [Candidatus Omnitrophota bacterium]|nr:type III pantothenate kinase [Candidatus Omnitrophota bacterium]HPS20135.1 type III pantothenate kinase [Candidatus Omnitrophota bacterium]